jgi:hypothetical protein
MGAEQRTDAERSSSACEWQPALSTAVQDLSERTCCMIVALSCASVLLLIVLVLLGRDRRTLQRDYRYLSTVLHERYVALDAARHERTQALAELTKYRRWYAELQAWYSEKVAEAKRWHESNDTWADVAQGWQQRCAALQGERDTLQVTVHSLWAAYGRAIDENARLEQLRQGYVAAIQKDACTHSAAYTGATPPTCGKGKGKPCLGCRMKREHYLATHPAPAQ